ncbi:hypothetical protein V8C34DRAFT_315809 [Trichoderma compactum]
MPPFWNRLKERQPRAGRKKDTRPDVEPKPLQGRLWNEAYEQLKSNNAELVESYETILSTQLFRGQNGPSESASLENQIDKAYGERWKQMQMIVEAALEKKKQSIEKKQKIGNGLAAVSTAMSQAVRAVPEAAVAWTGACFALEMVSNSIQEAKANNEGIVYVVSRMDWYWHLAELLSDDNRNKSAPNSLRLQMEKHIVDLYQKLLFYQMKSVCRYYRRHGPAIWRDAIKADDWTGQLDCIRNAEAIVQEDSRIFNALDSQRRLSELDTTSQVLRSEMQDIWPTIKEHILSKEEERCLKDLRVTDPRDDKSRIEDINGGLLQGAYDWAIRHGDFIAWRDEKANHMLWIKGDPGKGKTMLLCGIIDELQRQNIKPCYFVCQATDPRLNTATAVLCGLIYLLKYDQAGAALFQDANSWVELSQMFTELLKDPSLDGQVFMIDALDECQKDLERLLDLIVSGSISSHAKWIVSSRNWTGIEEKLSTISQNIRFSLELNEQSVSEAVKHYITHKTARLKEKIEEFPSDLGPLYERMLQQIRASEDILKLVSVVYRPITLTELASLLGVENKFDREDLEETVASCVSFLVVRDDSIRFVHQSAQDFLLKDNIFVSGLGSQHYTVFVRSLDILSVTLRRGMYNIRYPGALIEEHTPNEDKDVLRHARYSCVCWVDHLKAVDDLERENSMLSLRDNGIVHHFFKEKLLNWLEALGLMKKMLDAARVVRILNKLLAPLQVYSSALIFSPSSSIVWQMYEATEVPKWIITKPEMPVLWTARVKSLEGSKSRCNVLEFSQDGAQIASADEDKKVRIWDLETSVCLHTLTCPTNIELLAFSPSGKHLATGPYLVVKIWDLSTSTCLFAFTNKDKTPIYSLKFSFDDTQFAASYWRKHVGSSIRTWDLGTGIELKTHNLGTGTAGCRRTTFAPDGTHFASATDDMVHIFDTSTGACLLKIGQLNNLQGLKFSAASTRLMTKSYPTHFGIWDSITGECLRQLDLHRERHRSALSPGYMLATSRVSEVEIWDMTVDSFVYANVFSPDGTQLGLTLAYGVLLDNFFEPPTQGIRFTKLRLQTDLRIFGYQDYTKTPPTEQVSMRRPLSAFTASGAVDAPQYRPYLMHVYDGFVTCQTDGEGFSHFQFAIGELDKVLA